MLKLYGSTTSPFVRHCRIAALQEGHPFELIIADYDASAQNSPTKKVPYMEEGDLRLTDSTSIVRHIRVSAGKPFLIDNEDTELYCLANTALDTGINLFLLSKDGITDSPYLDRQKARMDSTFQQLNTIAEDWDGNLTDGYIRLGCLLAWVNYRERYDFSRFSALTMLDGALSDNEHFMATQPPPL